MRRDQTQSQMDRHEPHGPDQPSVMADNGPTHQHTIIAGERTDRRTKISGPGLAAARGGGGSARIVSCLRAAAAPAASQRPNRDAAPRGRDSKTSVQQAAAEAVLTAVATL